MSAADKDKGSLPPELGGPASPQEDELPLLRPDQPGTQPDPGDELEDLLTQADLPKDEEIPLLEDIVLPGKGPPIPAKTVPQPNILAPHFNQLVQEAIRTALLEATPLITKRVVAQIWPKLQEQLNQLVEQKKDDNDEKYT